MRRSIYDNSHNRNRTRIDARDSGNWATRLGVRGQHKDMRGNVIGGYGPDGQAFGTKQRQPGRMEPPMPNFTPAPAPAKAVQRPSYGPAPAPASTPNTQPKTAPRRAGIEPSMPKTNPLGAKLFPNRSAATPAAKLTQQIATNTPGARTSNINRLTGKPMGWRPGDDAPDASIAPKAVAKPTVEPADPPASAKPTPAWANKASPVAPSPTKMAPPSKLSDLNGGSLGPAPIKNPDPKMAGLSTAKPTPAPAQAPAPAPVKPTPSTSAAPMAAAPSPTKQAAPAWTNAATKPDYTKSASGMSVTFKPDEASAFAQREAARTAKETATRQNIAAPILAKTNQKIQSINNEPIAKTPGFEGSIMERVVKGAQSLDKGFRATLAKQEAQRQIQDQVAREKNKPTGSTWGNSFGNSFGR